MLNNDQSVSKSWDPSCKVIRHISYNSLAVKRCTLGSGLHSLWWRHIATNHCLHSAPLSLDHSVFLPSPVVLPYTALQAVVLRKTLLVYKRLIGPSQQTRVFDSQDRCHIAVAEPRRGADIHREKHESAHLAVKPGRYQRTSEVNSHVFARSILSKKRTRTIMRVSRQRNGESW